MISKSTEIVLPRDTKVTAVWSFLEGLTAATVHYYAHQFGTTEWWEARAPGRLMDRVEDMPQRLKEYELLKTLVVVVGVHYIFLISDHDTYQDYIDAFKERFKCQIHEYLS